MRVLSGSPISDRSYANLAEVAKRILESHQSQTGVDLTKLIKLLDLLDPTLNVEVLTWGNLKLTMSYSGIATGLKMVNGSLHVDPTTMIRITSFNWAIMSNGTERIYFLIDFEKGVFHSLRDVHTVGEIVTNGSPIVVVPESYVNNTIKDLTSPRILGISIENKTYNSNKLPLEFNTDENVSKITYSLDNQANVTITGNCTLSSLPVGAHSITIYATDYAGNIGVSETIVFNVIQASTGQQPSFIIAIIAAVLTFGIGLMLFFRKSHLKGRIRRQVIVVRTQVKSF